jgi:hypothetical protein
MLHFVTVGVVNIVMELGALKSIEEKVSVYVQCFLPMRTNFVKNNKPQLSYPGQFCGDRFNYVSLL